MRSLTSEAGNDRSMRASPSTSPSRRKWPTPALKSTTRLTGSRAPSGVGALPGAAPVDVGLTAKAAARAAGAIRPSAHKVRRFIAEAPGGKGEERYRRVSDGARRVLGWG